jgi:predicted small secreted protein
MLKRIAAALLSVGLVLSMAGCNTVEGLGKDVKAAGGAVEKAANKTKTY